MYKSHPVGIGPCLGTGLMAKYSPFKSMKEI